MKASQLFDDEMRALRNEHGVEAVAALYRAFAATARWVRRDGHGEVVFSAVRHEVSATLNFRTVVKVDTTGA